MKKDNYEDEYRNDPYDDNDFHYYQDDWEEQCADFLKNMDEDFPGWGDGLG